MRLGTKITLSSILGSLLIGGAIIAVQCVSIRILEKKQDELITNQAVAMGVNTARQVAATRAVYAKQIVGSLKPTGTKFSQNPHAGEAPLPAVFVGAIAEKLKEQAGDDGATYALRSQWNINPDQGIATDIEQRGWEALLEQARALKSVPVAERQKQFEPYWERSTLEDNTSVIRVMTADLASAKSCVNCHNALEKTADVLALRDKSGVKQFELGDLMGAVVTTVPISRAERIVASVSDAQAAANNKIWIAIGVGLLFSGICSYVIGRRVSNRVKMVTHRLQEMASGGVDNASLLEDVGSDELGEMTNALNSAIQVSVESVDEMRKANERQQELQELNAEKEREKAEAERLQAERERELKQQQDKQERDRVEVEQRRMEKERCVQKELRRKIDSLLEVVRAATDGDLTHNIEVLGDDPVDELAAGLGQMLRDLRDVISHVVASSTEFNDGSLVVAESSHAFAEGSQAQRSRVEKINEAVQGLVDSIDAEQVSASEAVQMAQRADELADQGSTAVEKSLASMNSIKASSTQIAEITDVISDIASQTNLLSLNATIEAARAGKHGLGFSVVADEVRKLAERATGAADAIAALTNDAVMQVEEGVILSSQTGDTLRQIIDNVQTMAEKINEIAFATTDQSEKVREVAQSVEHVAEVAERNAGNSQQLAASSEQLGTQANVLNSLVRRFKTDEELPCNRPQMGTASPS